MSSTARAVLSFSAVTSPSMRTTSPGPGKGCRTRRSSGTPISRPIPRAESFYFLFEHVFIHSSHRKAFLSHRCLSAKRIEKERSRVSNLYFYPILPAEILLHIRLVVGAVYAANVHALYLSFGAFMGFFEKIRYDGGVGTARERDKHFLAGDFLFKVGYFLLRDAVRGEAVGDAADLYAEILIHFRALSRIRDFRMELHAPEMLISSGGDRRVVCSAEIRYNGAFFDRVAVRFKYFRLFGDALKQRIVSFKGERMNTELAHIARRYRSAHVLRPHLKTETHSECRNAEVEYRVVERRRLVKD